MSEILIVSLLVIVAFAAALALAEWAAGHWIDRRRPTGTAPRDDDPFAHSRDE